MRFVFSLYYFACLTLYAVFCMAARGYSIWGRARTKRRCQVLQHSSESFSANSGPRALASSRKLSSTFVAIVQAPVALCSLILKLGLSLAEHRLA